MIPFAIYQRTSIYSRFVKILLILLLILCSCQQTPTDTSIHLNGATMGTTWSVSLHSAPDNTGAETLQQQLQAELDLVNALMSTYDPASEISRFNNQTGSDWFAISAQTATVVALAQEISRMSAGAFDISVGPLVELWGFGASARRELLPSDEQVEQLLSQVGYQHLQVRTEPPALKKLRPNLRIDLSAIAKGYAVDQLARLLKDLGINNFLIEVGGELQIAGQRNDDTPWKIAIEKPQEDSREVAKIFPLTDTALATSGNYRNFYVENGQHYSHTLDPVSGKPSRHKLASVTVLDKTCARADALATALMVLGEEKGRQFCEKNQIAAYFLIHEKTTTTVYASPAFLTFVEEVK